MTAFKKPHEEFPQPTHNRYCGVRKSTEGSVTQCGLTPAWGAAGLTQLPAFAPDSATMNIAGLV